LIDSLTVDVVFVVALVSISDRFGESAAAVDRELKTAVVTDDMVNYV